MAHKTDWAPEEVALAQAAGVMAELTEPHANGARFDPETRRVELQLAHGANLSIPVALLQGLGDAKAGDLADMVLLAHGTAIHFPRLNMDFTIPGLVAGIFGNAHWMQELRRQSHREATRKGGSARTAAKAAAARANGKKGGRPRKAVEIGAKAKTGKETRAPQR